MDKNFIKVDDLFRQRLGDGEERERSGAWLNMRELLDKEMPQQKRIGAFYWRRLFSAVAALSLIGTVCVSSYELSAAFRNRTVSEAIPEVPVSVNGEPAKTLTMAADENEGAHKIRGVRGLAAAREGKEVRDMEATPENTVMEDGEVSAPANVTGDGKSLNSNKTENNITSNSDNKDAVRRPSTVEASVPASHNRNKNQDAGDKMNVTKPDGNTIKNEHNSIASTESAEGRNDIERHTRKNASVAATARSGSADMSVNETRQHAEAAKTGGDHTRSKAHSTGKTMPVGPNAARVASGSENTVRPANTPNTKNHSTAKHTQAGKYAGHVTGRRIQPGNTSVGKHGAEEMKLAAKGSKSGQANLPTGGQKPAEMALNGTLTSGSKSKTPVNPHKPSNSEELHKLAAENINKLAAADIATMGQGSAAKQHPGTVNVPGVDAGSENDAKTRGAGASVAAVSETSDSKSGAKVDNTTSTPIHDLPAPGKRIITRLVVHERKFKVADNQYALRSDTISKERIEMDLSEKAQPAVAAKTTEAEVPSAVANKKGHKRLFARRNGGANPATPGMAGNTPSTQRKSGTHAIAGNAGGSPSEALAGATASAGGTAKAGNEIVPSAAASGSATGSASEIVPAAPAEEAKAKTSESKHKGLSVIKKLALAFNDVKNNASKTTFAPGLTAGVNSYFFGPSTLKGFQFGLTGDIIFNDSWNVMTELKYFHRVNNNTSVQDNYYTYTPVGAQYLKQLQMNSYSFSALHSLEMPVAVRYHMGNFNFYAGGNLLYAFSINTGASAMPAYNAAPEYVTTPGADDKGVLSESDFASRFGLGYLFGFSYSLSQNFLLDLRNVQTVWDNASTTGAKSISSQLYKTPSLQLSVMYRLGGNRSKD